MHRASTSMLIALLFAVPLTAHADGIAGEPITLDQLVNDSGYALLVKDVAPLRGKNAVRATVRAVWSGKNLFTHSSPGKKGEVMMPGHPERLKPGQCLDLPTYRPPRARAGKWVIARRYWNICPQNVVWGRCELSELFAAESPSNSHRACSGRPSRPRREVAAAVGSPSDRSTSKLGGIPSLPHGVLRLVPTSRSSQENCEEVGADQSLPRTWGASPAEISY